MSTTPTVYFIDDSATMREVIKIAFRRENINVVACHDAGTALQEIEAARPDIVITDVIMPDKDGYDVCQHIKSHPQLAKTPVILMSGVVNRAVAEKAFAVKADELLRKPFQPQDLIARVKHLLKPNGAPAPTPAAAANAAVALSSIFSAAATPVPPRSVPAPAPPPQQRAVAATAPAVPPMPLPVTATAAVPAPAPAPVPAPVAVPQAAQPVPVTAPAPAPVHAAPAPVHAPAPTPAAASPATSAKAANTGDAAKLKIEIMRLEGLVKKLQSELQAEREYSRALEDHVKTLQEAD
jgi:CheY-like chemotaxis protein